MASFDQPRISVAPMMDRTDRHFRWLVRRISRRTWLYTEMVVARAMVEGRELETLAFDPSQHPIALQLGGSEPAVLAEAAARAETLGFDEVNLNCGCPSSRVLSGAFGAALMRRPEVVARCVEGMRGATGLPVTVKCRIGVDDLDRYEELRRFVDVVADAGCRVFTVHARKAWLQGLSPKQNRTVPPLRYDDVARLVAERPDLHVELNGGVLDLDQARSHASTFAGVMIGRAAYDDPMMLAGVDGMLGAEGPPPTKQEVARELLKYAEEQTAMGTPLHAVTRHALGLWRGVPGGRRARGLLTSMSASRCDTSPLREAIACLAPSDRPLRAVG
jgi:tRNA-dihydrouridine synthase A